MAATKPGGVKGMVKAVYSGDSLVIITKPDGILQEKTIALAYLAFPNLSPYEPFARESKEFLRDLCIGKEVVVKTEYTIRNSEFCSLFIADKNISKEVVSKGWARVTDSTNAELLSLEKQAKVKGLGQWNKSGPSAFTPPSNLDAMGLVKENQGRPIKAIVEDVCDGCTLLVRLLPEYHFVKVIIAGMKAPSKGTAYGPEAKLFAEIRVLHRDVWIYLLGVDNENNLIGSVYYKDAKQEPRGIALELIKNGFAKYVESLSGLDDMQKAAELKAKNAKLRLWENYGRTEKFTGKVVEVVSGDCIKVADDSSPFGKEKRDLPSNRW